MKKTWKRWLGTVAAALVTSTALAQRPDEAGVATTRGQSPTYSEEGSIQMGRASASATGSGVQQTQFAPSVDAGDAFEDALRGNTGGYYAENGGVGFASTNRLDDILWRVGNQSLDAYGYNGGYTNINAFVPLSTDGDQSILFLNPRVNMTGGGNGGVNLGLGYRFFDPADDRVYGVSGWWDYDAGHRTDFNQMGVSLESLGRYFSTRFNASLPLEGFKDYAAVNPLGGPFFQGNNIGYQFSFLRDSSFQNYQLEVASPIPLLGRYGAEWALSGYGLATNAPGVSGAVGVAGRFEVQVSEDFWINTILSHDKIFGTNTSINLELTIPNGMQKRWLRPKPVRDNLVASVKRQYRVSAAINRLTETRFFLDPKDGTAIQVAHIDPTAANGAAAGSVLNPFGSIQDYMNLTAANRAPFDILYVGRNTVVDDDTDMNTSIELLNCQRLLGTGTLADGSVHQFQTVDRGDGGTIFDLPGFANGIAQSTGANPFLTNSGNLGTPVVRINGNYTQVTGFTIDAGRTANGIASVNAALVPRSVDSFFITNNTIQSATTAIDIRSNTTAAASGPSTFPGDSNTVFDDNIGIIRNNTIDGTLGVTPGVIDGISVTQTAGTGASALNLSIRNNTIRRLGEDLDADGNSDVLEDINGNGVLDPGEVDVDGDGRADVLEDINGNAVLDPGRAIIVTANAGTEILANTSDMSPFTGILDNTISSAGTGVLMNALAGSHIQLDVLRNSVTGSTDAASGGMLFNAVGGVIDFDVFANNTVTGGDGLGVAFTSTAGGDINFRDPLPIDPVLHPVADSVFHDNTISGNALTGLTVAATGAGSTIDIDDMTTNTISANGGSGIDVSALAGAVVTIGPMTGNTITNNVADGITGSVDGVGSVLDIRIGDVDITLALNTITGNTGNGINLSSTNGGNLNAPIIRNTIEGNTLDGIRYTLNNTTQGSIEIGSNFINDNLEGGIDINSTATAITEILIESNAIEDNLGGDGIRFQAVNSSVTDFTIQENGINTNRDNGINFDLNNTPIQNLNILNNGQGAGLNIGLSFQIIGDTFAAPFEVINTSDPGVQLTSFFLDIGPAARLFDTVEPQGSTPFQPLVTTGQILSSDIITGLISVTGNTVTQGTNPLQDGGGVVLVGGGVPDDTSVLDLGFNNFDPLEAFTWTIDVDPFGGTSSVNGSELIGSNIQATFTGGLVLGGQLQAIPGNPFGSTFVATSGNNFSGGISGNGLDGIRLNAINGSNIGNLVIDSNVIDSNGGRGINATVVNSTIATAGPAVISANRITGNTLEGVRFDASQNSTLDLLIGGADPVLNGNTITGNGDANVSIDLAGISTASVVVQNNTITSAVDGPNVDFAGDGIVFRTTDTSRLFNAQVLDNTITGNAGDGLRLLANTSSQVHATGDPTSPGLLVTGNTIAANFGDGIQIQREGDAIIRSIIGTTGGVGVDPLLGNTITGNTNHGININTSGGTTPTGVSTDITIGQNTISGNGTTTVGNGVNIVTNDDSQTRVDLISNLIQGLGVQDNGISVTTNNASVFGVFGGASSLFDGNVITGNTANGVQLTANGIGQLNVDILGNTQQSVISGNAVDGVVINDQSAGSQMNINIGNPASSGAGPGADVAPDAADVVIAQNGNDGIRVSQSGFGDLVLNVNNTLATGNRVTGGVSRHGLSYNADGQTTGGTANITVNNSTFVDFGDDGMHIVYDSFFIGGTTLNVNVTDSIIGQTQFSTNVGDGVDIEVHDNGARFNFDNNIIQNNGGDGFRIVTLAEQMNTSLIAVFPDRDANGSGQNETTDPDNPALPGTLWADQNFFDFTTSLSLTNNQIRFNGLDGVDLAVGAGTRLGTAANRTIVRGNTMDGNANFGFLTRTITNEAVTPPLDSVNNGENLFDIVRLDPMAFLFLAFGDNVMPNTTSQLNPTVTGGFIEPADAIKFSANRAIITLFDVNTNDLNFTTQGGVPVSTVNAFTNGWSTFTSTLNTNGNIFFAPINTGAVNIVP